MMTDRQGLDPIEVIREEVPIVQEIERNEAWYEGERRQCAVDVTDDKVQKRVLDICLDKWREIRDLAISKVTKKK